MEKLLIGTHNPAKFAEYERIFTPSGLETVGLADMGITDDIEEIGSTFEEIALQKSQFYAARASLPTLSDDGGLVIDALNGEPGVRSKRWLGRVAGDEELIGYTLERLKGVPREKRSARMRAVLCFYDPAHQTTIYEEAFVNGYIALTPSNRSSPGYPYRALFIVDEVNKYYDELTDEEHERFNHRVAAVKRLLPKINAHFSE